MKPTIQIRADNLALVRAAAGLSSNAALAQAMGVHPTTVSRTLKGDAALGVDFIAALLSAFPQVEFGQLFSVEVLEQAPTAVSA
ncbi:helix-turn-helix domain-containing protein [Pseudonocardia oceani]|uniref:Helix-turn-helix transcriptional regulator n=1 Tax=Pseudonocardia oceani TaxID=2792013 RepID=A0ABS6UK47_9PSEU|nr:helix-turn-helix transcriptional regulator [Pseudonocardia oceani]MBW0090520.1 helix-turn-helix transcriptional regulator [Pseudonocardia oceani]MBW0124367.1 helix-turn-helix transcriptional regulator [Pseudonocardia oceani]MBW0131232.1 helix-turn-helix transcriptional regulator [Pseudonocardia oceani]MBW0132601.1 helix-turn-helix transcriptional regulator [Pseudonocardia oceani]